MINDVGTYSICGLPDVVYQSVPKLATPPPPPGNPWAFDSLSLVSISLCLSYEKNSLDRYNFMETSRTNAQYKRNDSCNLLYKIE